MGRKKVPGDRHQEFGPTPKIQFGALGKQLASLAGLASIDRQSVQWHGKSFIQGGRKPLRDALYMPALIAIRWNPDLKAKYDQLRATGKQAKLVIVAIMRKLIEMANALVKAN
jgi:transposase